MNQFILVGPILSFRGMQDGVWKVSMLIGIHQVATEPLPQVFLDGKQCAEPVALLELEGLQVLRFDLSCKMGESSERHNYKIAGVNHQWHFTVPGRQEMPHLAYVSCNGISHPEKLKDRDDYPHRAWRDLVNSHDLSLRRNAFSADSNQVWLDNKMRQTGTQRFHLLMMGGDQIYMDSIWENIEELKAWTHLSEAKKRDYQVPDELKQKIEQYYYVNYLNNWLQSGRTVWDDTDVDGHYDGADAMAVIPTIMMWDDHDIFDGWGSYHAEWQVCPLFNTLFACARQAFWVFQLQNSIGALPELVRDPEMPGGFLPLSWQAYKKDDPLALPLLDQQAGFTSLFKMYGLVLIAADLRSERTRQQIIGLASWNQIKAALIAINDGHEQMHIESVIFMSSVPMIYPDLIMLPNAFDFISHDDVQESNLDDVRDHWAHADHAGERDKVIETLLQLADRRGVDIYIVSGDVHVAARGYAADRRQRESPRQKSLTQLISSAVMNPFASGFKDYFFLFYLNLLVRQDEINSAHHLQMLPFPSYSKYIMPERNWLALDFNKVEGATKHKLWVTWRCEGKRGFTSHYYVAQAGHENDLFPPDA